MKRIIEKADIESFKTEVRLVALPLLQDLGIDDFDVKLHDEELIFVASTRAKLKPYEYAALSDDEKKILRDLGWWQAVDLFVGNLLVDKIKELQSINAGLNNKIAASKMANFNPNDIQGWVKNG